MNRGRDFGLHGCNRVNPFRFEKLNYCLLLLLERLDRLPPCQRPDCELLQLAYSHALEAVRDALRALWLRRVVAHERLFLLF